MRPMPVMTRKKEFRKARIEQRSIDAENNTFEVIACVYDVVDDYNTRFKEGCFDEYALERLPTFVWSHDWAEPIGHTLNARNADIGNGQRGWILQIQLDVNPAVPRALQAAYQINSGTLKDVSVGFCRTASKPADDIEGVTDITGAECDENSLVIVGAVPGAKVLMSRSGRKEYIDVEAAASLVTRLAQGQIDLHEALGEIKSAAVEGSEENDDEADKDADKDGDKTGDTKADEKDKPADENDDNGDTTGDEPPDKIDADEAEFEADIEQALALAGS